VRHFFVEGGTKCYVVRVTGYGDVNVAASIQAVNSFKDFGALELDGVTAVPAALRVSALTPGKWGDALELQVEQASRFSLLLDEDITGGPAVSELTLKANGDVQVGSVLFLMEQVTGTVKSVNAATSTITFQPGITAELTPGALAASFPFLIADNSLVFSTDMKFVSQTDLAASVSVSPTMVTPATIKLDTVQNVRGEPLKAGDILNFGRANPATVIVKKISEKLVSGEPAMLVTFEPASLPSFNRFRTKAYARDFDIVVGQGGVVAETHTHLSLVN